MWSLRPGGDSNYVHDRLSFELEATKLAHDFYGPNAVLNNYHFPTNYNTPRALEYQEFSPEPSYENRENFHP